MCMEADGAGCLHPSVSKVPGCRCKQDPTQPRLDHLHSPGVFASPCSSIILSFQQPVRYFVPILHTGNKNDHYFAWCP